MSDAVLGVEASVSGRFWRSRLEDSRLAAQISQTHDLPEPVGRVLAARGVSAEAVEDFLNPRLRDQLPDPSLFAGMDAAVARLVAAVSAGETIAVFGDYDVDGATASAVLQRYFRMIGGDALIYIPDRMSEGYGPAATPASRRRGVVIGIRYRGKHVFGGSIDHDSRPNRVLA